LFQKISFFIIQIYSDYGDFLKINISQGSVATKLRCGGVFDNHLVAGRPQNVLVKEIWKSITIWRRYRRWQSGKFFGGPKCIYTFIQLKPVLR